MTRCEITSPDLARELPACPVCGTKPTIYRKCSPHVAFKMQVVVCCEKCIEHWRGIHEPAAVQWHPTLYEAVNCWNLLAKLAGVSSDIVSEVKIGRDEPHDSMPGELYVVNEREGAYAYEKFNGHWIPVAPF